MLKFLLELFFGLIFEVVAPALSEALIQAACYLTGRLAAALAFLGRKSATALNFTADDYMNLGFVIWIAIALIGFGCCAWRHRHSHTERPRRTVSMRFRIGGKEIFKSRPREVAPAN
jgi:hypothetical protein